MTTEFNKIAVQGKGPYGKWTRKPLAYRESNIFNLCVICPPEICVNLVFKNIHTASSYTICRQFMLLAVTQSVDNLFHSLIVLCENKYFLISNLHRSFTNVTSCPLVLLSFTNVTSCPLVLLSFLSEKKKLL